MNNLSPSAKTVLWVLWAALAVFGGLGVLERFTTGHDAAAYGSYVPWGLWVSAYIYFMGLSAGAFLVSSVIFVFGIKRLEPVGRLALFIAVVTLLMALLSIFFDLGREWRFYRVFTDPNFQSMMAWMIWLYNAYFILLLLELWLVLRPALAHAHALPGLQGRVARLLAFSRAPLTPRQETQGRQWLRVLAAFGIPLAISFNGGVGSLFGTVGAHAYWHTPLMPILFLAGALASGAALLLFTVAAFWPRRDEAWRAKLALLSKIVAGLVLLYLMFEWAEFSIPMWYGIGPEYDLMMEVLFGRFWYVFWVFHILLGSLIPLALLLALRTRPWALAAAGLLIAVTFFAVRLNIVIPAFVDPNLAELQHTFQDARLSFSYLPSLFEWQVVLGIVALGMALFYLGQKLLPLTQPERAST
jgi:protein NrfD